MSKHTPGPWVHALEYGPNITELPRITTVARCANYVIGLPSDYPGGNYRDGDPSGDEEADARLISQAPAMLEALYEQYAFLADITHNWEGRHTTAGQARLIALRDLIVQATGRDEMEVQDEASMPRAAKGGA